MSEQGDGGDWNAPDDGQPVDTPPAVAPQSSPASTGGGLFDNLETNDYLGIGVNWFWPGLGHLIFLNQQKKGIALAVGSFVLIWCAGLGFLFWPFAFVDAFLVAKTKKYREVEDMEFFPDYKEHFNL